MGILKRYWGNKNTYGRRKHPVAILLEKNRGLAFNVEKIEEITKMNKNTIRSILRKLIEDGYIVHQQPFFYWK